MYEKMFFSLRARKPCLNLSSLFFTVIVIPPPNFELHIVFAQFIMILPLYICQVIHYCINLTRQLDRRDFKKFNETHLGKLKSDLSSAGEESAFFEG